MPPPPRSPAPAVLLLVALSLWPPPPPPPPRASGAQQLSAAERAQLVALVWSDARCNFAGWSRVRADWDSALAASLRAAAAPQSDLLFHGRLRRLVARLDDGQAHVLPPPPLRARIARPPLLLTSVERRPLVLD